MVNCYICIFFFCVIKQGGFSGLFTSLALMFWIGIGAAIVKPPHEKALRFTNNCNLSAFKEETVNAILATPAPAEEIDR